MKVLYDFQGLQQVAGGVSRCICEYARFVSRNNDVYIICPHSRNIYLNSFFNHKPSFVFKLPPNTFTRYFITFLNMIASCWALIKGNYDVFHPTFDRFFYYGFIKKPFVLTIHDMIPEMMLESTDNPSKIHKAWCENRRKAIIGATRIMCVSEHTKNDLLKFFPSLDKNNIDVIYHGVDRFNGEYKVNTIGRYILYVGQRKSLKNFKYTVESLLPLFLDDADIKIVCTGPPFQQDEKIFIHQHYIDNTIIHVGYVSDEVLASLYHNALTFIYPSKYEGFGIPILEAFVNECPVCLANASCFPEIGGDAVCYFDPNNADSILESVKKVVYDKNYSDELREKGLERVRNFTWKAAGDKVQKCYHKAIESYKKVH